MKKVVFKLIFPMFFFLTQAIAVFPNVDFDLEAGLRHDQLKWSIAGYKNQPNILSELKWENIESAAIGAHMRLITDSHYYIRGAGQYGAIFSGSCQDSDYLEDNRKKEFSRSNNDASSGEVFDLSLGVGIFYRFFDERLSVAPLIGYSLSEQHLKMKHGFQKISTFDKNLIGPISGLNSSYYASWYTPFIGMDLSYQINPQILLISTLEWHGGDYKGRGHWNLREDFYRDFEHSAEATGFFSSFGVLYNKTEKISFGATLNYEAFKTESGRDRTYVFLEDKNKIVPAIADLRLNSVKWHAISLLLALKINF